MAMIGAFLGGPDTTLPAGKAGISLCVNTTDRLNLATASFTVTASGFNQTVQADASGRAYIEVDAGKTYTVTLNHQGSYENDGPQTVITESRMEYGVYFDLFYYPAVSTVVIVHTKAGSTVTATREDDEYSITATANSYDGKNGYAGLHGLTVGDTWKIEANGETHQMVVEDVYYEIDLGLETMIYGVRITKNTADPMERVTYIEDNASWSKGTRSDPGLWAGSGTPFTSIKPVMKKGDAWVDLNKRNLAEDVFGDPVDITTLGNDVFVEVHTWWLSIQDDGTYQYIRFANRKVDSTYVKLASMWSGQDVGMFHYGAFHCYTSGSLGYSSANRTPRSKLSMDNYIDYCLARGDGYDIESYHQRNYIAALLVLFFGTTGPSLIISGYRTGSAAVAENILTFDNDLGIAGSSSDSEMMSFLWCNAFWGNFYEYVGGARTSGYQLQTLDNGQPSDADESEYTAHDTQPADSRQGQISQMDCQSTAVAFFPKECNASASTYWVNGGRVNYDAYAYVGANYSSGSGGGPFYTNFQISRSTVISNASTRLCYRKGRTYA